MRFLLSLKSSLAGCVAVPLLLAVIALPVVALTGCTPPPPTTTLQKMQALNAKLPAIRQAVDDSLQVLAQLDPNDITQAALKATITYFDPLETQLQEQVSSYLANPTPALFAQIQNQINAFEASVNTTTLQAVGIKDPALQQQILDKVKAVSTLVTLAFAVIATTETPAQLLQLRHQGTIHLARLRPYLDERVLQQEADAQGVDLNRSFQQAEAFGL